MDIVDGQFSWTCVATDSAIRRAVVIDGHRYLVPAVIGQLVLITDRCPAELDRDDSTSLYGGLARAEVSTMSNESAWF